MSSLITISGILKSKPEEQLPLSCLESSAGHIMPSSPSLRGRFRTSFFFLQETWKLSVLCLGLSSMEAAKDSETSMAAHNSSSVLSSSSTATKTSPRNHLDKSTIGSCKTMELQLRRSSALSMWPLSSDFSSISEYTSRKANSHPSCNSLPPSRLMIFPWEKSSIYQSTGSSSSNMETSSTTEIWSTTSTQITSNPLLLTCSVLYTLEPLLSHSFKKALQRCFTTWPKDWNKLIASFSNPRSWSWRRCSKRQNNMISTAPNFSLRLSASFPTTTSEQIARTGENYSK